MYFSTRTLRLLVVGLMLLGASAMGRAENCASCQSKGTIPCPKCNGTGIGEWISIHGQPAAYGCERCGGVRGDPMQGTGRPGSGHIPCPTCGGSGKNGSVRAESSASPRVFTPPPDIQRRKEDQRQKELAAAKRQQDEFDQIKRDLFERLKGTGAVGSLSLKESGITGTEKEMLKEAMDGSPAVVDLRHLDPAKPIVVDPDVVRGVSETLRNPHYQAGFEALLRSDYAAAVTRFERAKQDRPDDPLVRNALLLAQDLFNVHRTREQVERNTAAFKIASDAIGVIPYDLDLAVLRMREAHALSPDDRNISETLSFIEGIAVERANARNRVRSKE